MSFRSLAFSFRVGETTVGKIIKETCTAINGRLLSLYMQKPNKENWQEIRNDFHSKWNFPNCVGAVDGKHVHLFAPNNSGSNYFNYKGGFSIVLMAVVDANYKYVMIDVGSYGKNSDGGIFANCSFGKAWLNNYNLDLPESEPLPFTNINVPLVLVADEAFPLRNNILRPFPGRNLSVRERIFNYRLSRARRVVENAFGITSHMWRILLKKIEVNADYASIIVVTCCTLHNFLIIENATDDSFIKNSNTQITLPENCTNNRFGRPTKQSMDIRNIFADWFITPAGEVPWQNNAIK